MSRANDTCTYGGMINLTGKSSKGYYDIAAFPCILRGFVMKYIHG